MLNILRLPPLLSFFLVGTLVLRLPLDFLLFSCFSFVMLKHLKPLEIGLFEHCFHTVKQCQTHSLKQLGQQVAAHTTNMIQVSHVALEQTEVSGQRVMEASDLRMLRPEADRNILRGLILVSVASTQAQGE